MTQQKPDLDKITNLLNQSTQGMPKGKPSKPTQEPGPGFLNRLQSCLIRTMALGAIISLSAAIGAIFVLWLVPPSLQVSPPMIVTTEPVVITQTVPVLVTVEVAQGLTCPTVAANECPPVPTPPLPVVVIATSTPVLSRLTIEQVSNQTQKITDPSTNKVSLDQETTTGYFYEGKQVIGYFTVINDHLTQKSSMTLRLDYAPFGNNNNSPDGIRLMIEFYQSALPDVEKLIKYPVK